MKNKLFKISSLILVALLIISCGVKKREKSVFTPQEVIIPESLKGNEDVDLSDWIFWEEKTNHGLSLVLGTVIGILFCQIVRKLKNSHEIFIIVFGTILVATGLSIHFHLSLILTLKSR